MRCIRIHTNIDLTKVRFNSVQYNIRDLESKIYVPERNRLIVDTWMQYVQDKRTVESEFFGENEETFSPEMMKYLSRLSPLQREVLHLISIGYTPNEILGELHINKKLYDDCYQAIHSYRNIEILM